MSVRINKRSDEKYIPVQWSCQRVKSCTGVYYEYYTTDVEHTCLSSIGLERIKIMSERIVWFLVHDQWPSGNILFRDGDKKNISIDNLVHISPRIMNQYSHLVRRLDKNYISKNIAKQCAHKNKKKRGIRFNLGGKTKYWSINTNRDEIISKVYYSTLTNIVDIYITKLDGIDMSQYHRNPHRHKKIQKAIAQRKSNGG